MSTAPTPEEAARALTEAGRRGAQVHKADAQLGWMLAILAGVALAIGVLMSLAPRAAGPAVLTVFLLGIALVIFVFVRIRAYSRSGLIVFVVTASTFAVWNSLVAAMSVVTRWWAPSQAGYHFGVSAAIGVLPLLVGIWLLTRKWS